MVRGDAASNFCARRIDDGAIGGGEEQRGGVIRHDQQVM
jgi:hypothetical protein